METKLELELLTDSVSSFEQDNIDTNTTNIASFFIFHLLRLYLVVRFYQIRCVKNY